MSWEIPRQVIENDLTLSSMVVPLSIQQQFVSLKSSGPTLRIALYVVFATNVLAVLRHLNTPGRYAVIIDFIGNGKYLQRGRLKRRDSFQDLLN
jgi:hypothetical protein